MTLRFTGVVATVVVWLTAGSGVVVSAPPTLRPALDESPATRSAAVFLTLPMANGFADATDALVEAKQRIRESLDAMGNVHLVDHAQDADVTLIVLGRGTGHEELTAALKGIDRNIIAPPVPIAAHERYIETMLTVGWCNQAVSTIGQSQPNACYSRIFVGLGLTGRDARRPGKKPASNSWEVCANAIARDVHAWLMENATRLQSFRE